jgi:glutaredoxin
MAAPMSAEPDVLMYVRPGCGLCDEAREVIFGERNHTPFRYEEVDVTESDDLELEYGIRIPVVLIDGQERFELRVDPRTFAEAVRTASGSA